jgi:serine/threonine protein kinase
MLSELYWDGFRLGLVTELLGPSLKKWINDQPVFTEGTAKTVAQTLLKAIKYMHSRGK